MLFYYSVWGKMDIGWVRGNGGGEFGWWGGEEFCEVGLNNWSGKQEKAS
jgi:hypothetical protein